MWTECLAPCKGKSIKVLITEDIFVAIINMIQLQEPFVFLCKSYSFVVFFLVLNIIERFLSN